MGRIDIKVGLDLCAHPGHHITWIVVTALTTSRAVLKIALDSGRATLAEPPTCIVRQGLCDPVSLEIPLRNHPGGHRLLRPETRADSVFEELR